MHPVLHPTCDARDWIEVQQIVPGDTIPSEAQFTTWVEMVWRATSNLPGEVVIRIVDLPEMRELNKRYRGKNAPTNVLSFPAGEVPGPRPLLGDIAICAPVVEAEAAEQNYPLEAHWAHLCMHGVLHLLGYDHIHAAEADVMEALEVRLLAELGYPSPYEQTQSLMF